MKTKVFITAVSIVLLLTSGSYLYGGQSTGVTDSKIKIGSLVDLTGPSSFLGRGANTGAESYFKSINDNGGINGRKIIYIAEDNKYQPATSVSALKKLVHRDKIFAVCFSWGTVTTLAISNEVKKKKIPTIFLGNSNAIFNPFKRYIFSYMTTYDRQAYTIADYIVNNLKAKDLRFACIYQDDQLGRGASKAFKDAAKIHGAKWVGDASCKRGALDFSSQVIKLKKAGAKYIYLATVTRESAGILREANKQDWRPRFIGASASTDKKMLELAGNAIKDTYLGCTFMVAWHEDTPGMRKIKDAIMKYHGTLEGMVDYTMGAWVGAMLISEGMKRSGKNLTRDGLVDAMETIKDFDPDGLMPPITWGPKRREGEIGSRIMKVNLEKKIFEPATGWKIPTN